MIVPELTQTVPAATSCFMQVLKPDGIYRVDSGRRVLRAVVMGMLASGSLAGCVQVSAPDKPIVIELNINIRQEVIYKLAADAANTIEENKDIF